MQSTAWDAPAGAIQMIFDTSAGFTFSKVGEKTNLIDPNVSQHESAVAAFAFDLTALQSGCLNDALEEQLDDLLAIGEKIILPGASFFRQLPGGQHPTAGLLVKMMWFTFSGHEPLARIRG